MAEVGLWLNGYWLNGYWLNGNWLNNRRLLITGGIK